MEELFNANDQTSQAQESRAEWSLRGFLSPPARGTPIGTNRVLSYSYRGVANPWAETGSIHPRHGKCMRKKRLTDKKLIKTAPIMR